MKGVISVIELASTAILLLITFAIFFPYFEYEHKWEDATLLLKTRDLILTMDRMEKLYEFSFNPSQLEKFLNLTILERGLVKWSETQGTFKPRILVACNCTQEQINNLSSWIGKLKLNERYIVLDFVQSNLDKIVESDVLFIWGYKSLDPFYNELLSYIQKGNGIIEMMDFTEPNASERVNDDRVQTQIFGLRYARTLREDRAENVTFARKPLNVTDLVYYPYKHFYHVPILLRAFTNVSEIEDCEFEWQPKGNFTLNQTNFTYWICSPTTVWFDRDGDGVEDILVEEKQSFQLQNFNLTLSYVEQVKIALKFNEVHWFSDFVSSIFPPGEPLPPGRAFGIYRIFSVEPGDGNERRILLYGITARRRENVSVAILNGTELSRVAWIVDLSKNNRTIQTDEKLLLASLILWASNKRSITIFGELKLGFLTSYVNVVNRDMFEVYEFGLGIGYPY